MHRRPVIELHFDRRGVQGDDLAGHLTHFEVIADALTYTGFATLEPHLLGGGPTGGVTGPDLFPKAVAAFRDILVKVGAKIAA